VQSYLEGLYWVLIYYHKGCGSWTWYYPYLYAPLASDLVNLASIEVKFEAGRPFTPLLQLLSVLPPQSGEAGCCNCGCAYMRVVLARSPVRGAVGVSCGYLLYTDGHLDYILLLLN
jgi:hypothetical protein